MTLVDKTTDMKKTSDALAALSLLCSAYIDNENVFSVPLYLMENIDCDEWMTIFNILGLHAKKGVIDYLGPSIYVYLNQPEGE